MKYLLALLVFITLGFTTLQAKTINLPAYTIESAIKMANDYIEQQQLVADRHYLKKVEYHGIYSEYKQPYWRVEYHLASGSIKTAGGQVFVILFNNGKIEHTFGE